MHDIPINTHASLSRNSYLGWKLGTSWIETSELCWFWSKNQFIRKSICMVSIELMITPTKSWSDFSPWSDSNVDPFKGVRRVPVLDILIMGFHSHGGTPLDASKWTILLKWMMWCGVILHFRKSSYMIYFIYPSCMIYYVSDWWRIIISWTTKHFFAGKSTMGSCKFHHIGTAANMSIDIDLKWMSWNHQTSTCIYSMIATCFEQQYDAKPCDVQIGRVPIFWAVFLLRKFLKDGWANWFQDVFLRDLFRCRSLGNAADPTIHCVIPRLVSRCQRHHCCHHSKWGGKETSVAGDESPTN